MTPRRNMTPMNPQKSSTATVPVAQQAVDALEKTVQVVNLAEAMPAMPFLDADLPTWRT